MPTRTQTLESTYRIYLGDLRIPIVIHIWSDEGGHLAATTSHRIKTPSQASGYVAGIHFATTPEEALGEVVKGYETYYDMAVEEGHAPHESWLEPVASHDY